MSSLTRLLISIVVLAGTAAAPAEQSADAFIKQFVADVHAGHVDGVRDRLFRAEGKHPEAGKRQTESILEAVRGGVLGLRVLEVRAAGDAAAAAVTELRIKGRQPSIEPLFAVRRDGRWTALFIADHFEMISNLTDDERRRLGELGKWFEEREGAHREAGAARPEPDLARKQVLNGKLALAAGRGDEAEVRRLIDEGADVNFRDRSAGSPIEAAAKADRVDIVRLLVEKGASVDPPGEPLLLGVMQRGKSETIKLLIELGADVNRSWRDETPLATATRLGRSDVVRMLLDAKAKPQSAHGTTLLHLAATSGDLATFEQIRPLFPDPKVTDALGRSALHAVATGTFPEGNDREAIVAALLKSGLDPHATMAEKNDYSLDLGVPITTPLRVAAVTSEPQVVAALVERVAYEPAELTFVLALSVRTCPAPVLQKLLDRGADVNGRGSRIEVRPPLFTAAQRRHLAAVKLFLERGADPNVVEASTGRTPLLTAVASGTPELVEALLAAGADPTMRDKAGHDAAALLTMRREKGREGTWPNDPRHPEWDSMPDAPAQILRLLERPPAASGKRGRI